MTTLLMATDFSPESDLALKRACQLAAQHQARLVVLHSVDAALPLQTRDKRRLEAEDLVQEQIQRCAPDCALDLKLVIEAGRIAETILRNAVDEDASLIILGQHHQASPELFVGTTLERVSRLASVPVLLVVSEQADYRQGLVALDASACASQALRMAAMLLDGGSLHAMHICHPPMSTRWGGHSAQVKYTAEQQETLENLLEDELETLELMAIPRPTFSLEVSNGGVLKELLRGVSLHKPGFIALGSHGRSGLGEALLGGLALEMLRQPPCDVLVAR